MDRVVRSAPGAAWACVLLLVAGAAAFAQDRSAAEEALRAKKVTLDLKDVPLARALEAIKAQTGAAVELDPKAAEPLAKGGDRFTTRVKDAPAAVVLDGLLRATGLALRYDAARNALVVAPVADAAAAPTTVGYPVADLLPDAAARPAGDLERLVRATIERGSWDAPPHTLALANGTLWVTHGPAAHDQVRALLDALRREPETRVEFRGALLEMTLEAWRAFAPTGARALKAEEIDELVLQARGKGRLLREFATVTTEGEAARFLTESLHPYVREYRLEREGGKATYVPVLAEDAERIACELRPAVIGAGEAVRVDLRCELRRREGTPAQCGTPHGPIDLPRAIERRAAGSFVVAEGQGIAWRLGSSPLREEPDRVLALVVRAAVAPGAAPGGVWLAAAQDARLRTSRLKAELKGKTIPDALMAFAADNDLGLVLDPSAAAGPAGGRTISLPANAMLADLLRALRDAGPLEAWSQGGVLWVGAEPKASVFEVHRCGGLDGGVADGPAFVPLDSPVRALERAGGAAPVFGGGTPGAAAVASAGPDLSDQVKACVAAGTWESAEAACIRLSSGRLLVRQLPPAQGQVAAFLDRLRGSDRTAIVVEADVIEVESARMGELVPRKPTSGLAIEPALCHALREQADRQKGVQRLQGYTWSARPGQSSGAASLRETAWAAPVRAAGVLGQERVASGLQLRVRAGRAGEAFDLEVEGEWVAAAPPEGGGEDGVPAQLLPALSRTAIRGSGRLAAGGALLFPITTGVAEEEKTLFLVVTPSSLGSVPAK